MPWNTWKLNIYQIFDCFQMSKKYIMIGWNRSTYTNCISLFFPTSKKVPLFKGALDPLYAWVQCPLALNPRRVHLLVFKPFIYKILSLLQPLMIDYKNSIKFNFMKVFTIINYESWLFHWILQQNHLLHKPLLELTIIPLLLLFWFSDF